MNLTHINREIRRRIDASMRCRDECRRKAETEEALPLSDKVGIVIRMTALQNAAEMNALQNLAVWIAQEAEASAESELEKLDGDYWVTVCAACQTAACWHGELMCGAHIGAGTEEFLASALRPRGLENQQNYRPEKIISVEGWLRGVTK